MSTQPLSSASGPHAGRGSATAGPRVFDVAFQGLETLGPEPRPELLRRCPRIVGAPDTPLALALCAIHRKERRWIAHHPVLSSSSFAAADSGPAAHGAGLQPTPMGGLPRRDSGFAQRCYQLCRHRHAGGLGAPARPCSAGGVAGSDRALLTGYSSRMRAGAGPRECAQSGSVRGSPKADSGLLPKKPVMALIWLPARVSTRMPLACAIGACWSRT